APQPAAASSSGSSSSAESTCKSNCALMTAPVRRPSHDPRYPRGRGCVWAAGGCSRTSGRFGCLPVFGCAGLGCLGGDAMTDKAEQIAAGLTEAQREYVLYGPYPHWTRTRKALERKGIETWTTMFTFNKLGLAVRTILERQSQP